MAGVAVVFLLNGLPALLGLLLGRGDLAGNFFPVLFVLALKPLLLLVEIASALVEVLIVTSLLTLLAVALKALVEIINLLVSLLDALFSALLLDLLLERRLLRGDCH